MEPLPTEKMMARNETSAALIYLDWEQPFSVGCALDHLKRAIWWLEDNRGKGQLGDGGEGVSECKSDTPQITAMQEVTQ